MELSFSNASLFSLPLERFFRLAGEAGFRKVEIMVTRDPETRDAHRLNRWAEDHDLQIGSIHAPFLWAAKRIWGSHREKIERSVNLALATGAEVVVAHLPYVWEMEYARWLNGPFIDYVLRCPVTVALENAILPKLGFPVNLSRYNRPERLKDFPFLVFDTSHFAMGGHDIHRMWDLLGDKVVHIHLSNNYLKGMDDHALPHEGFLPLGSFLRRLSRDGFPGTVVLELSPTSLEARLGERRVVSNLKRSLEFCLEHLQD